VASPHLLTAPQVAKRLGEDVRTVRKMIGLGQLPSRWVGSRNKVPAEAVELYVAVRDGTEVGSMTAFALFEALTQTEEGRAVMASLRQALAQADEASHVTGERGDD
jgi:excisionase family DNA binding protein